MLDGHGLLTIDADRIGHKVLSPGGAAVPEVAAQWPDSVVNGSIDRSRLAAVVFSDPAHLKTLESLTHPHIFREISSQVEAAGAPVIVEMPLLIQPFAGTWLRIIVDAPDDVRRRRAVERGLTEADVERRMNVQPSRSQYLAAADIVIPNGGSMEELAHGVELLATEIKRRGPRADTS